MTRPSPCSTNALNTPAILAKASSTAPRKTTSTTCWASPTTRKPMKQMTILHPPPLILQPALFNLKRKPWSAGSRPPQGPGNPQPPCTTTMPSPKRFSIRAWPSSSYTATERHIAVSTGSSTTASNTSSSTKSWTTSPFPCPTSSFGKQAASRRNSTPRTSYIANSCSPSDITAWATRNAP